MADYKHQQPTSASSHGPLSPLDLTPAPAAQSQGGATTAAASSASSSSSSADRAMSRTTAWKPAVGRQHSWSKEEHKHAMQMGTVMGSKATGPGFSENGTVGRE